ncbi:nitroreductase [Phlyctema vagabunda]|uniref:Nitroreductase n=1 Tax=Phlyctema vagabunda TaxID=108571 RepID=A0ABR4PT25_9HELO
MSSPSDNFVTAISSRISCYNLINSSPISDSQIDKLISSVVTHTPSAFNVQSARAVVLLKHEHEKLWDIGDALLKKNMPATAYQALAPKVRGYRSAYGSVLWFEDQTALQDLAQRQPAVKDLVQEWSYHSSGMHQFAAWTALELEGFGCNLQHYNFMPEFCQEVAKVWDIPENWKLQSQLVFGMPENGLNRSRERTYVPTEDRVRIIGA